MGAFLQPGERILWQGRPLRHRLFRRADLFLVPVSLLWFGVVLFWAARVPVLFVVWGVPALLAGLYIFAGRFVVRVVTSRRTRYTLTSARLVVQGGFTGERCTIVYLKSLPPPVISVREDGTGSLAFGEFPTVSDAFEEACRRRPGFFFFTRRIEGWRLWANEPGKTPVLWDIADVRRIRDVVAHAQSRGGA
ncbi:hypothetical protein HH310_37495 [Actinoplanes sp. TBRC 11911]|uniref:hypothetical protein n=1 Tax=Actinoplanes sp. TBRC 11911 TaxID=2729386 RepID=UPI00145DC1EF|nr:hypothetical protein [Actinoplanes sp. TBRC 11911]NMO56855.1 hypothetical protein [Actinoplanes sp. TBRC 11911]